MAVETKKFSGDAVTHPAAHTLHTLTPVPPLSLCEHYFELIDPVAPVVVLSLPIDTVGDSLLYSLFALNLSLLLGSCVAVTINRLCIDPNLTSGIFVVLRTCRRLNLKCTLAHKLVSTSIQPPPPLPR